jgi:acetyl-CoA C-acetyltransferase
MTEGRTVVILGAARTPVGKYGGSLKEVPPTDLGAIVVREAIRRAGIDAQDVDQVVFGNVIHTEARDMYFARVVALHAGVRVESPALTVNRLCGSGLQAIGSAAQEIVLGNAVVTVAGGAESMSRAPYWLHGLRWGQRMNNAAAVDFMVGALTDPFAETHMGIPLRISRGSGTSPARIRTHWLWKAIDGLSTRSSPADLGRKSYRWN